MSSEKVTQFPSLSCAASYPVYSKYFLFLSLSYHSYKTEMNSFNMYYFSIYYVSNSVTDADNNSAYLTDILAKMK